MSTADDDRAKESIATIHSALDAGVTLFDRSMEWEVLPTARELGIGIVTHGILAQGLLSGKWSKERVERGEIRPNSRFELLREGNLEKNLSLVERLRGIAEEKQITVSQRVNAWAKAKGEDVIPLIGVSKLAQFRESLGARDIVLSAGDMARIEAAIPENEVAGNSPEMRFRNGTVVR